MDSHTTLTIDSGPERTISAPPSPERTISVPASPRSSTVTLGHASTATLGHVSTATLGRSPSPDLDLVLPDPPRIQHDFEVSHERSTAGLGEADTAAAATLVSLSRRAGKKPWTEPRLPTFDALSLKPSQIKDMTPRQRHNWMYYNGQHVVDDNETIRHPLKLNRKNEATSWKQPTDGVQQVWRVYRPTAALLDKEIGEVLRRWRYCTGGLPVPRADNSEVHLKAFSSRLVAAARERGYEFPTDTKTGLEWVIVHLVQLWREKVRRELGPSDEIEAEIAEAERKVYGKTALYPVPEASENEPEPEAEGTGKGRKRKASEDIPTPGPPSTRARVADPTPPPSSSSSATQHATSVGLTSMSFPPAGEPTPTPSPPLAEAGEHHMMTRNRATRRAVSIIPSRRRQS